MQPGAGKVPSWVHEKEALGEAWILFDAAESKIVLGATVATGAMALLDVVEADDEPHLTRLGVLQLDTVLSNKVPEGHEWRTFLADGVFVLMHW